MAHSMFYWKQSIFIIPINRNQNINNIRVETSTIQHLTHT